MEFIINHVVELDQVHDTDRDSVVKWLTCTSIVKNRLGIVSIPASLQYPRGLLSLLRQRLVLRCGIPKLRAAIPR